MAGKDSGNNNSTSDNEGDLFKNTFSDVKPLVSDRVEIKKNLGLDAKTAAVRRSAASFDAVELDKGITWVEPTAQLSYRSEHTRPDILKQLKNGHIQWEASIDLHGFTIDQALQELSELIDMCCAKQIDCIRVIHGKGFSGSEQRPVLKSYCNHWLAQMPQVLAFCSAPPKDGGSGALYVLLQVE